MNLALNNQTMSSREIAELTGKRHDNVKRTMESLWQLGLISFTQIEEKTKGRPVEIYNVNEDDSYVVVARLSPEFTARIVKRWRELEEAALKPQLPQSKREWIEFALEQEKKLELAAPKVEFHDKLVNNESSYCIRDAAKSIKQRPNKLKAWLRESKYLCMNNLPMQRYIDQGLFVTHTGISGTEHEFKQARMTNKGLAYFTNKLGDTKL